MKLYRFQVYNCILHIICILYCVYHPKPSLLPSPFILPLPSSTFPYNPYLLAITILLSVQREPEIELYSMYYSLIDVLLLKLTVVVLIFFIEIYSMQTFGLSYQKFSSLENLFKYLIFKKYLFFFQREGKGGRKRRETSM